MPTEIQMPPFWMPQVRSMFIGTFGRVCLRSVRCQDPSGRFLAGIWDSTPMTRAPSTIARSELMHILEGSGSITNADGVVFEFGAGDTFLVPIGMGYQWHCNEYVKKLFCSYTP